MNYWPSTPKKLPDRIIREFKGTNKQDRYLIGEGFSPKSKNLYSGKTPALTVRPGFSALGLPVGTRALGLFVWKNTEIHAVFNDGTWRKWTGSAWTTLKSGLSTTAEWAYCNFKANLGAVNLIAANGVDPVQRYDGATVQNLANAPAGLKFIDQHDNRLYGATNNTVHFSGLSLADQWTLVGSVNDSSPGQIVRETNDGENIVGLKSGAGNVTVFFPNSSHELYGTSPSDYSFIVVADDIGAINDQSITNLGGLIYFLDETGIYIYGGGTRPIKKFSQAVQWHVDNMNKSAKNTCCMGSDGRYLYVGIPMMSNTSADTILVYDSIEQTWDVWDGILATHMVKMGETLYMGDSLGRVLKIGGTTDDGLATQWEWQSKPFTGQSMGQNLRWTQLWITLEKPFGSAMSVYVTPEPEADSGWVLVANLDSVVNIQGRSIPIHPTAVPPSKYLRLKITGFGPMTIREISWNEIQSAVV